MITVIDGHAVIPVTELVAGAFLLILASALGGFVLCRAVLRALDLVDRIVADLDRPDPDSGSGAVTVPIRPLSLDGPPGERWPADTRADDHAEDRDHTDVGLRLIVGGA